MYVYASYMLASDVNAVWSQRWKRIGFLVIRFRWREETVKVLLLSVLSIKVPKINGKNAHAICHSIKVPRRNGKNAYAIWSFAEGANKNGDNAYAIG